MNYRLISIFKSRAKRLRELGLSNYGEYLASDWWHARRAAYWASHERRCRYCNEVAGDLHHRSYRRLGAEPDEDLEPLCSEHHREAHENGSVQPATEKQRTILREHRYAEAFVAAVTFGGAFELIGKLARGEIRSPRERGW